MTFRVIPYSIESWPATAGPEKLSPFWNVADQVPLSEFGA